MTSPWARLASFLRILRIRGWRFLGYLVTGFLVPRIRAWVVFESPASPLCRRLLCRLASIPPRRRPSAGAMADSRSGPPEGFLSAREWLPAVTLDAASRHCRERPGEPVVLGRIDNDGRVLALLGPLPGLDPVDATGFVERYRYGLDLILDDDAVLIRKDFRGDRPAFLREWRSLAALGWAELRPR